jgi:hypothetical protein
MCQNSLFGFWIGPLTPTESGTKMEFEFFNAIECLSVVIVANTLCALAFLGPEAYYYTKEIISNIRNDNKNA